ncbi:CCE_0567 family metalloprotein [Celerinatantimonas sp. MCCC 1A17872]|uniref:CCE_0567 family metalloprotein n=1 Tax=Celerinatantimonas sp. MCCC 1A17872 TaxID=3177514 RepID=UPI0038BE8BFD
MDELELKTLRKSVRRAKRIASEHAAKLHDLVEDRLPSDYQDIPQLAEDCYGACQTWAHLNAQLNAAEAEAEVPQKS